MASVLHWKKKASRLDLIIFKKIPGSIWFRLSIKELGGAMGNRTMVMVLWASCSHNKDHLRPSVRWPAPLGSRCCPLYRPTPNDVHQSNQSLLIGALTSSTCMGLDIWD